MVAKIMASDAKHRHNIGRRRYRDLHAEADVHVIPLRNAAGLHFPKVSKLTINRDAPYALSGHAGMRAVCTFYKDSQVLWLEGDVAQPGPISDFPTEDWKRQVEHRTSRSAKDELVDVLRQYIGSWVAIRSYGVIVSHSSPIGVISFLREHNLRADSILRVPRDPMQEVGDLS